MLFFTLLLLFSRDSPKKKVLKINVKIIETKRSFSKNKKVYFRLLLFLYFLSDDQQLHIISYPCRNSFLCRYVFNCSCGNLSLAENFSVVYFFRKTNCHSAVRIVILSHAAPSPYVGRNNNLIFELFFIVSPDAQTIFRSKQYEYKRIDSEENYITFRLIVSCSIFYLSSRSGPL